MRRDRDGKPVVERNTEGKEINVFDPVHLDLKPVRATGTVTDPAGLAQLITTGLGRGKHYGGGLVRHRVVG